MKPIIVNMNDMSDSREVYDSRPHPFFSIFIYLLITLIISALAWSYFGEIEEYVKVNGAVRPSDNISTIKNSLAGLVENMNLYEGMGVNKGDVLFTIGTDDIRLLISETEGNLKKLDVENKQLGRLKQSVYDNYNYFDANNPDDIRYFNRFQKYLTDKTTNVEFMSNSKADIKKQIEDSTASIESYTLLLNEASTLLVDLQTVIYSMETGENKFSEIYSEYSRSYEDYAMNLKKLLTAYEENKKNYVKIYSLYEVGGASLNEANNAKYQMDNAELEYEMYMNTYTMSTQEAIRQTQANITEYKEAITNLRSNVTSYESKAGNADMMLEKLQNDILVEIEQELKQIEYNIDNANSELKNQNLRLEEAIVKAPIDGVINLYTEINAGDFLLSGIEVATITPSSDVKSKVQLMIPNKDIAGIEEGQMINYQFHALPSKEYGELKGMISLIGKDSRVNHETGINYYIAEASIENKDLVSYKGESAQIRVGMTCEARIITKTKKILYWLLEKIDILD